MAYTALRQLAPDLWVAERALPLKMGDLGARMTVVRVAGGGLLVVSPVALDGPTRGALEALGAVRWIVAPNKHHHLFAAEYVRHYPEAGLFGPPGLPEKRRDLPFTAVLGAGDPPPTWPAELPFHLFQGAPPLSEVVFLHRPSRTLILADLAFNVPERSRGKARLFYWLTGASGRFGPHRLIRWSIRDRRRARASLDHILTWDFDRVIVSHGEVLEANGKQLLELAFGFL